MDRLERIKALRDEYEAALDDAGRLRAAYYREIVKLHASGMSLRQIAEGLGISHQRVHQIVTPAEEKPRRRVTGKATGGAAAVVLAVSLGVGGGYLLAHHAESTPQVRTPVGSPLFRDAEGFAAAFVGNSKGLGAAEWKYGCHPQGRSHMFKPLAFPGLQSGRLTGVPSPGPDPHDASPGQPTPDVQVPFEGVKSGVPVSGSIELVLDSNRQCVTAVGFDVDSPSSEAS